MFDNFGIFLDKLNGPVIFLISCYLVIIIGVIVYYFYKKYQYVDVKQLVQQQGLKQLNKRELFSHITKSQFSLLSARVSGVKPDYIFHGKYNNYDICLFCLYMVNGQFKRTIQTAVYIQSEKLNFPNFMLKPVIIENSMDKIFGEKDISFLSDTNISKNYILKGNNEDQIRTLLKTDVINYLERNRDVMIEANGKEIIIFVANNLIEPDKYRIYIEKILGILRLFEK